VHNFKVRVVATTGETRSETVRARVPKANIDRRSFPYGIWERLSAACSLRRCEMSADWRAVLRVEKDRVQDGDGELRDRVKAFPRATWDVGTRRLNYWRSRLTHEPYRFGHQRETQRCAEILPADARELKI
jgi:hypothetical protein